MVFYLIGTPLLKGNSESTWKEIQNNTFASTLSTNASGKIISIDAEKFRLGNLDTLMNQNDQMIKLENNAESLLKKIERQYLDITDKTSFSFKIETREGECFFKLILIKFLASTTEYIKNFKWDDSKFVRAKTLQELNLLDHENQIRGKTQAYQDAKQASNQIAKKEGNLYTRDLVDVLTEDIVKEGDFYYSDNITTLVVIINQSQVKEWLANYEKLSEHVIPGSAKKFNYTDKENLTIWRVQLLKVSLEPAMIFDDIFDNIMKIAGIDEMMKIAGKEMEKKKVVTPVEEFIQKAREKLKVVVREFEYKKNESGMREVERIFLEANVLAQTTMLSQTCVNSFSDVFINYLHLKNLRFIVDIAMRFGIGEPTLTCLIEPANGKEKKVVQSLVKIFSDPSQIGLYGTKEELEDTEDFFPFIYIPINIT